VYGAILAQRGSPSWLAFFFFGEIRPATRPNFAFWADVQVSNGEFGPGAIFGRVAGRKLPNKLDARQDEDASLCWFGRWTAPSRRRPARRPASRQFSCDFLASLKPRSEIAFIVALIGENLNTSVQVSKLEAGSKGENRTRSGPIFAKISSRGTMPSRSVPGRHRILPTRQQNDASSGRRAGLRHGRRQPLPSPTQ